MNARKSVMVLIVIMVIIGFSGYTTFSYTTQPVVFKVIHPNKNSYNTNWPVTYPSGYMKNTFELKMSSDTAFVSFTGVFGALILATNASYTFNTSNTNDQILYSFVQFDLLLTNETIGIPGTSISFTVLHSSLESNDSYMILPMSMQLYSTDGIYSYQSPGLETPKSSCSGYEFYSLGSLFNQTGLAGVHKFWVNMTIEPTINFGPFYEVGTPEQIGMSWVSHFSN